jgi:DNA invertase Pin-like site-specific DNA recombinase
MTKAAIWTRVSTDKQHNENQLPDLERLCAHRGWDIVKHYTLSDVSAYNGAHRSTLHAMVSDAHRSPRRFSGVRVRAPSSVR